MTELNVCIGSSCHVRGAHNVIQSFQHLIEEHRLFDAIEMKASHCLKKCSKVGVSVTLNGVKYNIPESAAKDFFLQTVLPAARRE